MRLRDYRKMMGLTQADMAARLGVRRDSYARYEIGLRRPRTSLLTRIIAETAGAVTPNDFFDLPALATEAAE